VGLRLVLVVVRPDLIRLPPELFALFALRSARPSREDLVLHLQLDFWGLRQVLVPARILRGAAFRRNDHVAVAVLRVDERRRARLTAFPTGCRKQEDRRAFFPDVSGLAAGLAVDLDVLVAVQALGVGHLNAPSTN